MVSTHMSYGFLIAYLITFSISSMFPQYLSMIWSFNTFFVLAGLLGGGFPDIDRLEQLHLHHRRSLHYPFGYLIITITLILLSLGYFIKDYLLYTFLLSCFFIGAWLHSIMDILDGFWMNDVNKGVYEHITGRWLRAWNIIPFASLWEWSLQTFAATFAIAISPHLVMVAACPGWIVATTSYFFIWGCLLFMNSVVLCLRGGR